MPKGDRPALEGKKVLITRPKEQASRLSESIVHYGGRAIEFPLLETKACKETPEAFAALGDIDMMIFVSRSAARYVWKFLPNGIPESIKVAVVGDGTRQELIQHGRYPDVMPMERFDSEGLLELGDMEQVEGLNIVIVRGQNGRETLLQTLQERGANVSYAQVYQRIYSKQALTNAQLDVDAIVITSSQALEHFLAQAEQSGLHEQLLEKQLVVIHPRIAARARELGFSREPLVAAQASDSGILKALLSINYL